MKGKELGVVPTHTDTFAQPPDTMTLEGGQRLGPVTLAYETYGELDDARANAILVAHALSGDAHAAGLAEEDAREGWWEAMIGPKKALDTDRYFVLCANVLGGCKGSTGPASINPQTGQPYALDFPLVTIEDMVRAQRHLIDHLGIKRLLAVIGGSMGGMQALQWAASYPDRVRCVIPIATTLKHSPQQIAFDEVGRQAVMADPAWQGGRYYGQAIPEKGLAVARMIGHITYMSDASMEQKFSRRLKDAQFSFRFAPDFEVEGYLHYRGENFVKRFDANSYLYITKAMDYFDLSGEKLIPKGRHVDLKFLVIAFTSDWLYPAYQSQEIIRLLKTRKVDATYCEIRASHGHDAFLLDVDKQAHLVQHFLRSVTRE